MASKHKKMLYIICRQGNADEDNNEMPTTRLLKVPKSGTLTTANGGEDVELQEFTSVAGGDAKWYNHF